MAPQLGYGARLPAKLSARDLPVAAYDDDSWSGPLNVASVDLMAMVVSDSGLASTQPEWWNSSPIACLLIAFQPRGGWQVMQRAVQWGNDLWSRSFGVNCKMPSLYCYFACSMRNRLEVWDSENFVSPLQGPETPMKRRITKADNEALGEGLPIEKTFSGASTLHRTQTLHGPVVLERSLSKTISPGQISTVLEPFDENTTGDGSQKRTDTSPKLVKSANEQVEPEQVPAHGDVSWKTFDQYTGTFSVRRPTKLTDGSRGGQAFMCSILRPEDGNAYSVEEQARLQFLSIVLVAAGLIQNNDYPKFMKIMQEDFELGARLGIVFKRLVVGLIVANPLVIGLIISVFYSLWGQNLYGEAAPYVLQLCSLTSWTFGATGLLMLGGNPRVRIDDGKSVPKKGKSIPKHIMSRLNDLDDLPGDFVNLDFGSMHGSIFTLDRGSCYVRKSILKAVCGWNLHLTRGWGWGTSIAWFLLHIGASVALQVAGSKVATVYSQILGIVVLFLTSIVRGRGVSGPEEWMIPKWRMRKNARYAVVLQGQVRSRL